MVDQPEAGSAWPATGERRRTQRRAMLGARVPAALIVQMAASRAEIGPFAGAGRATPAEAARAYRQAAQPAPRLSGQPTQRRS